MRISDWSSDVCSSDLVQAMVVKRERISDHRWRTQMSYLLTNARPNPVTLDLVQRGLDWYWDDTRILTESRKSERLDSDGKRRRIDVPANGEATITATFETRDCFAGHDAPLAAPAVDAGRGPGGGGAGGHFAPGR